MIEFDDLHRDEMEDAVACGGIITAFRQLYDEDGFGLCELCGGPSSKVCYVVETGDPVYSCDSCLYGAYAGLGKPVTAETKRRVDKCLKRLETWVIGYEKQCRQYCDSTCPDDPNPVVPRGRMATRLQAIFLALEDIIPQWGYIFHAPPDLYASMTMDDCVDTMVNHHRLVIKKIHNLVCQELAKAKVR